MLSYVVGLNVQVSVLHSVVDHHHSDALTSDVTLPQPRHVDVHATVKVIVLEQQEKHSY